MANVQQLIDQINASSPGSQWKVVGNGTPVEETAPVTQPADAASGTQQTTVNRGTGRYYVVIQDSEGHQRAMPLKADPIKGGLEVQQSGVNDTVPDTTPDAKGRVDPAARKPNPNLYGGDLKSISWSSGGPIQDVPQGAKEPSTSANLDRLNSRGEVIPPGTPYNANDPATKPVQARDPKTGTTFNISTDPAGTLHDLGNDVILVKPDGSYTTVATKPKEPTQFNVPGVGLVDYDPTKPEGQRSTILIKTPDKTAPTTEIRNGTTYQWDPDTKSWLKTDLPAQQDIGYTLNDPNSEFIIFFDKQGKEVGRTKKPDWKPPINVQPGTAPAGDQVSAKIPKFDPQTGALEFVDNPNQQKASDATAELATQLGLKVAAGSMSEDQAQKIITGAVNAMNAQTSRMNAQASQDQNVTTAAGDLLRNTSANATTGAGLLQQRAQTASGMLQNILGQATGAKNLMSAPAGLGEQLVGGIGGWTADMMGGQSTLDSAARMVQMADPSSNMADPATQTAVGVLHQMLDKYQQTTGMPYPAVAATQAAQQSAQNGGLTAPVTTATQQTQPVQQRTNYGGLAQGGANMGGMNLYPTPGSPGMPIGGLAQGGGGGMPLQQMPGFVAPGAPVKPPPVTVTVG